MTILITGAAGFIGSQVAHRLWEKGFSLILLDNFSYGKEDNLVFPDKNFNDEIIRGDIRDKILLEKIIKEGNIDTVLHIAGIAPLPDCQSNPQQAVEVNVLGTVNVLELSKKYGVSKIIFASTSAIYENDRKFPSVENNFELPSLIYANTKYAAERFCQSYCDVYGMNITALRFANVYGPHIDFLRKQPPFVGYMIRELLLEKVPTFYSDGTQSRDYIYVEDLIDLMILCIESKNKGFEVLNVSSNKSYSVNEIFEIAKKIINTNIEANFLPSNDFWKKYPELYKGLYPIRDEILLREVNKKTLCDNTVASQKYNWKPKISLEQGLGVSIDYIKHLLNNK